MTSKISITEGVGKDVATNVVGGEHIQLIHPVHGVDGTRVLTSATAPLPVVVDSNGAELDAFSRLRVSEPFTIFQSMLTKLDKAPLLWDEQLESGAGITGTMPTAAKPFIDVVSTVSTAGVFTRQTLRRFSYQPGKSQLITMTGVFDLSGGGLGVQRRMGYFDDDNGVFFEDNQGNMEVVVRSNITGTPVDTKVTQTAWNIDKMDGTGASGIAVDWSKAQILLMDFQWLSVGRVRFSLDIGGVICPVHDSNHANILDVPFMSTPALPLRYQMVTTASSAASSMRAICCAVISEGGSDPITMPFAAATTAHINANVPDTIYAIVGIKLGANFLGTTVDIEEVSVLAETADDFEWMVIFNPTIAGAFTYSAIANSSCEFAVGATANTVTGGTVMDRGFANANAGAIVTASNHLIKLGSTIAGVADSMVLCVRPLGLNADIQGALHWAEQG